MFYDWILNILDYTSNYWQSVAHCVRRYHDFRGLQGNPIKCGTPEKVFSIHI